MPFCRTRLSAKCFIAGVGGYAAARVVDVERFLKATLLQQCVAGSYLCPLVRRAVAEARSRSRGPQAQGSVTGTRTFRHTQMRFSARKGTARCENATNISDPCPGIGFRGIFQPQLPTSGTARRCRPDRRAARSEMRAIRAGNCRASRLLREVDVAGFDLGRLRHHAVRLAALRLLTNRARHARRGVAPQVLQERHAGAGILDQDGFGAVLAARLATLRRRSGYSRPAAKHVDEVVIRLDHLPRRADRIVIGVARHHGDVPALHDALAEALRAGGHSIGTSRVG